MPGFGIGGYGLGPFGIGEGEIPSLLSLTQPIFKNGATITALFDGDATSVQIVFKEFTNYTYRTNDSTYPIVSASIDDSTNFDSSKGFYFKAVTTSATYYYGYNTVSTVESNAQNSPYLFSTAASIPLDTFDALNITNATLYLKSESAVWTSFELVHNTIWEQTINFPNEFLPDENSGYYFKLKDDQSRYIYLGESNAYLTEAEVRNDTISYYTLVNSVVGDFYVNTTGLQELQIMSSIDIVFTLNILNAEESGEEYLIEYISGTFGEKDSEPWGGNDWYTEVGTVAGVRVKYYTIVYNGSEEILFYIAGNILYSEESEAEDNSKAEYPIVSVLKTNDLVNPKINDRTPTISWVYAAPSDEVTSAQQYMRVQLSLSSKFRWIDFDSSRIKRSKNDYTYYELDKEGKLHIRVKVWDQLTNVTNWSRK